MTYFSSDRDANKNIGEMFFEALLSSYIDSIANLDLNDNSSWFYNPKT